MIKALAEYEQLTHEVTATEQDLRQSLFGPRPAGEVVLAYSGDVPVGFALFFHNFSTFLGKQGLYLEDLFVVPEWRGRGVGKQLLAHVAAIAESRQLWPPGVDGARLERVGDRLLSQHGRACARRVAHLSPDGPRAPGGLHARMTCASLRLRSGQAVLARCAASPRSS